MLTDHLREANLPLTSSQLTACQAAFDAACADLGIDKGGGVARRLAVYVFEYYRQGIGTPDELRKLAALAIKSDGTITAEADPAMELAGRHQRL